MSRVLVASMMLHTACGTIGDVAVPCGLSEASVVRLCLGVARHPLCHLGSEKHLCVNACGMLLVRGSRLVVCITFQPSRVAHVLL